MKDQFFPPSLLILLSQRAALLYQLTPLLASQLLYGTSQEKEGSGLCSHTVSAREWGCLLFTNAHHEVGKCCLCSREVL